MKVDTEISVAEEEKKWIEIKVKLQLKVDNKISVIKEKK